MRGTVHAQALLVEIERSIADLAAALRRGHSEEFRAYLRVMARFHRYSSRNVWLILRQRPGARFVAGHVRWRSLGRRVRPGERGIAILAPTTVRRVDPASGQEESGVRGFHVARVWDLDQTDGRPLPDYIGAGIEGRLDPGTLERAIGAAPLPIRFDAPRGDGQTEGNEIRLAPNLSPARTLVALAHEWAHVLLHFRPEDDGEDLTVEARELEAEATAFVVAAHFGIADRSGSDYILSYGGSAEALERRIERVSRAARTILDRLEERAGKTDSDPAIAVAENAPPFLPKAHPLGEGATETRPVEGGLEEHEKITPLGRPLRVTPREPGLRGEEHLAVPTHGVGTSGEKLLLATAENAARIGDAGTEGEEQARLAPLEARGVLRSLGSRSDEGHASGEDVEELRPFVDLAPSEPSPETGHTGVAADGEGRSLAPRTHGAELVQREGPPAASEALLSVEDRSPVDAQDEERDRGGGERQQTEKNGRKDGVPSARPPHRR